MKIYSEENVKQGRDTMLSLKVEFQFQFSNRTQKQVDIKKPKHALGSTTPCLVISTQFSPCGLKALTKNFPGTAQPKVDMGPWVLALQMKDREVTYSGHCSNEVSTPTQPCTPVLGHRSRQFQSPKCPDHGKKRGHGICVAHTAGPTDLCPRGRAQQGKIRVEASKAWDLGQSLSCPGLREMIQL